MNTPRTQKIKSLKEQLIEAEASKLDLFEEVKDGNLDNVKKILCYNKDVNIELQNVYGDTALMCVCENGRKEIAELLIEKGANIDLKNKHGNTALTIACIIGHKEIVELLIEKGANVELQNITGSKVLGIACRNGYKEIVELLKKKFYSPPFLKESLMRLVKEFSKDTVMKTLKEI